MKRKLSILLAISLVFLTAASCGESEGEETTAVADGSDTTADEETSSEIAIYESTTDEERAALGLDGYEFNVMIRDASLDWSIEDLISDGENGEVLNDAVYRRNLYLEDLFGFTIRADDSEGTELSEMTTLILSGDTTYDVFFPMGRTAGSAATQGLLYDLYELDYLDFDNSCWNDMIIDALEIGGKLYYAAGSISTNSFDAVETYFFNKTITEDLNLENPYALVKDGSWTLDKFNEMVHAAAADLNGDTIMDTNDRFGYFWQDAMGGLAFYYGSGESLTQKNADGIPELSIGSERSIEVYDKISDMISDKTAYGLDITFGGDYNLVMQMFYENKSLFMSEVVDVAKRLRPYEVDFGIIPTPKFDENQEDYIQYVNGWCLSPVVIPVNSTNPERTSFFVEALAEASERFLTESYYETVLTEKALRDEESVEMLEIVVNNFTIESCDMYQWGALENLVREGMRDGTELATILAANTSAIEAAMEKTIETIESEA